MTDPTQHAAPTIDLAEMTRRLGLPADQQETVLSFAGVMPGIPAAWTEAEAAELADVWRRTCPTHGICDCDSCARA